MPKYALKFFGHDGFFAYTYGEFDHIEWAFRTPRVDNLTWTFDGDGWSSENVVFEEPNKTGNWYIARV